jgi:hypothetical protein
VATRTCGTYVPRVPFLTQRRVSMGRTDGLLHMYSLASNVYTSRLTCKSKPSTHTDPRDANVSISCPSYRSVEVCRRLWILHVETHRYRDSAPPRQVALRPIQIDRPTAVARAIID